MQRKQKNRDFTAFSYFGIFREALILGMNRLDTKILKIMRNSSKTSHEYWTINSYFRFLEKKWISYRVGRICSTVGKHQEKNLENESINKYVIAIQRDCSPILNIYNIFFGSQRKKNLFYEKKNISMKQL